MERNIITIDGPAGAGKSTVSKILARQLHYIYLDTGAMYRVVGLWAQREKIDFEDDRALEKLCGQLAIDFQGEGESQRVLCQGEDVTEKIRDPEIGWLASTVSTRRPVREAMVALQRKIGSKGKIVAEGRDTGTVVFPWARYKFFLSADPSERARRRFQELIDRGYKVTLERIEEEIKERDAQDSLRALAPLQPAADAHFLDSTNLTPAQVVEKILRIINNEGGSSR
jgi:cytidylate kinase